MEVHSAPGKEYIELSDSRVGEKLGVFQLRLLLQGETLQHHPPN